jgi:hypothetical protein
MAISQGLKLKKNRYVFYDKKSVPVKRIFDAKTFSLHWQLFKRMVYLCFT